MMTHAVLVLVPMTRSSLPIVEGLGVSKIYVDLQKYIADARAYILRTGARLQARI